MPQTIVSELDKVVWSEFAAAALQGILQQPHSMNVSPADYANRAALIADELQAEYKRRQQ